MNTTNTKGALVALLQSNGVAVHSDGSIGFRDVEHVLDVAAALQAHSPPAPAVASETAAEAVTDEQIEEVVERRWGRCPENLLEVFIGFSRDILALAATPPAATKVPSEHQGKIDANALERMAKERPDEMFLKGSGVLKLIGGIRQLEAELRALRSPAAHGATTRETAWQPMGTAPKDGTRIMLGIAGVSVYPAADLYLLATWDGICSHPYVPNTWTHWMPLPEGPDAARKVTPPSAQQEGAANG